MARIDKFIEAMHQLQAERLVAVSGDRVTLDTGAERRPVTSQAATLQQVEDFLRDIVPPGRAPELQKPGNHEFPYASPSGPVLVQVHRSYEALEVHIAAQRTPVIPSSSRGAPAPVIYDPNRPGIEALFGTMVAENCSDLHLSTGNPPLYRKDGEIVRLGADPPLDAEKIHDLLLSIAPAKNRAEFEEVHDTDFSYEVPGLARFRCNLFRDLNGIGGVFRVIPSKIPAAKDLGIPPEVLDLCNLPKGLVLVTGPTGSGKSTTLAAMIDYINRNRSAHIITIEDPVEFVHPNKKCLVNQREIGTHTGGFKTALRAALREDPDIVLVGEMRDLETVAIAIETAETGHLVFGTLHTNTAPSTVDRVIDQFPTDQQEQIRTMLSESLRGVTAQTLCKKKGGGRVAAMEVLIVNPAVSNLIREGKTFQIPSIMQTGRAKGMITMNDALLDLVLKKLVEPKEAYAKAIARTEFKKLLARNGVSLDGDGSGTGTGTGTEQV